MTASIHMAEERMGRVMRTLRARTPLTPLDALAGHYRLATTWHGEPCMQPLVWFATRGCAYALERGGCTMCDFGRSPAVSDEIVEDAFARVVADVVDGPLLHVAACGSFFDDREVSPELRGALLDVVARTDEVRALGLESRPEHLTLAGVENVIDRRASLGARPLEELSIGVGLESTDEFISRVLVHKGFGCDEFLGAVRVVRDAARRASETDVVIEAHVLAGLPFLTDDESVGDAIRSTRWALREGAERVILMVSGLKTRTLAGALAAHAPSLYERYGSPPSLWIPIRILNGLEPGERARVRVFGFESSVPFDEVACGCDVCSAPLRAALNAHNLGETEAALEVARSVECSCRSRAGVPVVPDRDALNARVGEALDVLESALGVKGE